MSIECIITLYAQLMAKSIRNPSDFYTQVVELLSIIVGLTRLLSIS